MLVSHLHYLRFSANARVFFTYSVHTHTQKRETTRTRKMRERALIHSDVVEFRCGKLLLFTLLLAFVPLLRCCIHYDACPLRSVSLPLSLPSVFSVLNCYYTLHTHNNIYILHTHTFFIFSSYHTLGCALSFVCFRFLSLVEEFWHAGERKQSRYFR